MAAGESATVFLETSLGTRLVVSFPACATTVADLKRQVSAEHAACFPRAGPIAVTSLQVKHDGALFHLTDSMAVEAAFRWVKGPWHLLVEAHEVRSHPLARKDANCRSHDAVQNASDPVAEDSTRNVTPPVSLQEVGTLALGDTDSDNPEMNQQDKPNGGIKHTSNQRQDGNIMPSESLDLDFAGDASGTPPTTKLLEKYHKFVKHVSCQLDDGNLKTMPQESSDLDVAADKDKGPVRGLQKDAVLEPRGNKRFREEDKDDENIVLNCDGCFSSLASSTLNVELSELKSRGTEQENLNSNPLPYNLGDCSHVLGGNPSFGQKEPWTSGVCNGEVSNSGSDIPPFVEPMDGDNAPDKELKAHRSDEEEPQVAGLCAGESTFNGIDVPRCVESMDRAHELFSHSLGCQDAKCITSDAEQNASHPIAEDSTQNISLPVASQGGGNLASGNGNIDTPQMSQQDKPHYASGHHEYGNAMPQESSDLDLPTGDSDNPPTNQQEKSHEAVVHDWVQRKDGIMIPQESSDLAVTADKENCPVRGQLKEDIIVEPRGNKHYREEDGSLSFLANSTPNVELSEKKSSGIERSNLNGDSLTNNLGDCSHGSGEKPSCGQKEPCTSGVCTGGSSNSGSDIPPCAESIKRENSSGKEAKAHRGEEEGPQIAGSCAGESSCKGTDVQHCVESMKEDERRPTSDDPYLNKRKFEGTSTVSTEPESCCQRRQHRFAVRKVSMSKAMKMYAFRC